MKDVIPGFVNGPVSLNGADRIAVADTAEREI